MRLTRLHTQRQVTALYPPGDIREKDTCGHRGAGRFRRKRDIATVRAVGGTTDWTVIAGSKRGSCKAEFTWFTFNGIGPNATVVVEIDNLIGSKS